MEKVALSRIVQKKTEVCIFILFKEATDIISVDMKYFSF